MGDEEREQVTEQQERDKQAIERQVEGRKGMDSLDVPSPEPDSVELSLDQLDVPAPQASVESPPPEPGGGDSGEATSASSTETPTEPPPSE